MTRDQATHSRELLRLTPEPWGGADLHLRAVRGRGTHTPSSLGHGLAAAQENDEVAAWSLNFGCLEFSGDHPIHSVPLCHSAPLCPTLPTQKL